MAQSGQMALKQLHKDGVLLDFVKFSDKPTCLAIVSLNKQGAASYEFVIEGTATFDFSPLWLPDPVANKPALLHIGTLVTAIEPAASVLFEWAKQVAKVSPIVFDPNIRPAVMSDRAEYVKQVERWVSISSAVKVSDDDMDAKKVIVADTVGAGDTVGAILVEAIIEDGLDKLTGMRLSVMLDRAAKAAAITVSRTGALPPSKDEI